MAAKAPPAGAKPAPGAASPSTKAVHHVQISDEDSKSHDGTKVKKVLTSKYNMEQLKKITEFDSWVDDELERLCPKGKAVELDFEEWDSCAPDKRTALLEEKLAVVADKTALKKFIAEYSKRGAVVLDIVHSAALQRTLSGSKLN